MKFHSTFKWVKGCWRYSRRSLKRRQISGSIPTFWCSHLHPLQCRPSLWTFYFLFPLVFNSWCRLTCLISWWPQYCPALLCCDIFHPLQPCRQTLSSPPLPPSLLLFFPHTPSPTDRLIHFIVCRSLQVYPRRSVPAVDRLCVGVPAAEVSRAAAQSHQLPPGLTHVTLQLILSTTRLADRHLNVKSKTELMICPKC